MIESVEELFFLCAPCLQLVGECPQDSTEDDNYCSASAVTSCEVHAFQPHVYGWIDLLSEEYSDRPEAKQESEQLSRSELRDEGVAQRGNTISPTDISRDTRASHITEH